MQLSQTLQQCLYILHQMFLLFQSGSSSPPCIATIESYSFFQERTRVGRQLAIYASLNASLFNRGSLPKNM